MSSPIDYIFNQQQFTPVISTSAPPESNIVFHAGASEILKVTEDGFYIRGKRVPADEKEAEAVYRAFKQFLVHHALTKEF